MAKRCMGCMEEFQEDFHFCPNCGYEEGTPPKEAYHIKPGSMLKGRYLIGKVLGFGGFGITYIGYDTVLNHKVAIKEYLPSDFSTRMPEQQAITVYSGEREEQFIAGMEKFLDEARKLANFKTEPGIVHIYDCLEENYTAYIVMEYLEGESLKEKLEREGRLSVDEALDILMAVLKALEAVHTVGIIHRDIAPDNIYITKDGIVKVLDFGAARYATSRHSKSLSVIIKPGYAPEEQYRSRGDQGPWTDVYAAAATFYKMVTGTTPEDAMERAVKDTVKEPSKLGVPIKKSVETAIMNAMNVRIEGRTKTAQTFEDELKAANVKRVVEKKKKTDIGKWSVGMKVVTGVCTMAVIGALAVAAMTQFKPAGPGKTEIPEGQVRVPNLVNQEKETAIQMGQEAQLNVQIYDKQYSNEILADKVLSQETREGTLIALNDTLRIVVSAGIEKTYVPDFLGMAKEEVEGKLLDAGLKGQFTESAGFTPPGTVVSQGIAPDTQVDTGTEIPLEISLGMEGGDESVSVTIPDLTGWDYDEAARKMIGDYIYLTKTMEYSDTLPEGIIISQEEVPGTVMYQTQTIHMVVSAGKEMVHVPDIQYKSEEEAMRLLAENGLEGERREEYSDSVAAGSITSQTIPAGESVEKGARVAFYVSKGARPAENRGNSPTGQKNRPTGQQPPQTQPAQTQPAQTQPAQTQPAQTQPAQTQPPQTQPQTTKQTAEDSVKNDIDLINKWTN